jgi:DNA-binding transcriptional ArsR family regulator
MKEFRISEIDELLAEYCHATSNPRRSLLIRILGEGAEEGAAQEGAAQEDWDGRERTVSELVELTGFSAANISQHLKLLRDKRIVAVRRQGGYARYRLAQPKILEAMRLMREAFLECLDQEERLGRAGARGSASEDGDAPEREHGTRLPRSSRTGAGEDAQWRPHE